jgi:hypothetical protein
MHPVKLVDIRRVQTQLGTDVLDSAVLQTNFDFTLDIYNWSVVKSSTIRSEGVPCQHFVWSVLNLFALRHFLSDPVRDDQIVWVSDKANNDVHVLLTETQFEMQL